MNVNAKPAAASTVLKATPETVHWGYLDATIKPVLTIGSGERVRIECATCNPEWMPPKDSGFDILPDIVEIHQQIPDNPILHHLGYVPVPLIQAGPHVLFMGDPLELETPNEHSSLMY